MALDVNFGDALPPGHHVSITVKTSLGEPQARVQLVAGPSLDVTVRNLDTNKYKVRFFLPQDASGEVKVSISAGSEKFEESKKIG